MIFEDVDSYFKSGLEEPGVITTDSGSYNINGIFFDKEDQETFMEMEIETDELIYYVKKSTLPGDQKKGDPLSIPGRNNDNAYKCRRFEDDKSSQDVITAIYLSKD